MKFTKKNKTSEYSVTIRVTEEFIKKLNEATEELLAFDAEEKTLDIKFGRSDAYLY